MQLDDRKFEEYLSQFRPREPRALGARESGHWQRWGRRVAAAAVLTLIAAATLVWMRENVRRRIAARAVETARLAAAPPQSASGNVANEVSLGRLVILYNRDPAELDAALAEASRNLLPDVERQGSTLHSLDHD